MKFLVIGLGSMGKRRIRNLIANGETDIIGFDLREDRRKEVEEKYNIKTFDNIDTILGMYNVDAFIISVPPDKHMEYANTAFDRGIHSFIEASVTDYGVKKLIEKSNTRTDIKICPSCTLRFHSSIKLIKRLIDNGRIGKVSNFSYHSGQYLPDWHPWESITNFYVSNKETGGCREIVPFELTWLNWIFGKIENIYGFHSKTIDLGVDIDDVYTSSIKYKSGVLGNLLVDVVSRYAIRTLIVNGDKGQIQWDWNKKVVNVYYSEENRWVHYEEPKGKSAIGYNENIVEEMYIDEIKHFINTINNKGKFPNTLQDDYEILQKLYELEKTEERIRR